MCAVGLNALNFAREAFGCRCYKKWLLLNDVRNGTINVNTLPL